MANLSPNFTLDELTKSTRARQLGLANIPDDAHAANLIRLCEELLEPIRRLLNTPIKINSGYRAPQLNAAVGGVPTSAHMDGRAADFVTPQMDLSEAWRAIEAHPLPFDQLIWEKNGFGSQWIHIAIAKHGEEPRKQILKLQARPFRKYLS